MEHLYAVVMAGGRGERFWPLSEGERSKPFVPLLGRSTLIQETVERLDPLVPPERILVAIAPQHLEIARAQLPHLPDTNYIVEPVGRDTSACLGYAALHLDVRDPEAAMAAVPSDHFVDDAAAYRATLQRGLAALETATAVVFGVRPTRPETGYGYIQAQPPGTADEAWPVVRFVEKPDAATAARFVASGDYFWNSGIFLWRNRRLLELFRTYMPATFDRLGELRPLLGRDDAAAERLRIFSTLERISIDFGILEKAAGLRLIPIEFGWDDIGNWAALERALARDRDGNVMRGPAVTVEARDCVLYSDTGMIAAFGVADLVIVQANGKVLVCPKGRAADLKRLVASLDRT